MPTKAPKGIRPYYVGAVLDSVSSLVGVIDSLTEEEIHHCLTLEANGQKRKSIIAPLVRRAARINKQRYLKSLEEKHDIKLDLN